MLLTVRRLASGLEPAAVKALEANLDRQVPLPVAGHIRRYVDSNVEYQMALARRLTATTRTFPPSTE